MPRLTVPASRLRQTARAMSFLDSRHPIYSVNRDRWLQNEARYAGGDDVLEELEAFDWETDPKGHILTRQNQAIYINFPEIFCSAVAGHLLQFAPKPGQNLDFGGLGKVSKNPKKATSRADQVYQNPDGPGNTGSGWDLWWTDVTKLSMVTGHRWIYVESPDEAPITQARETQGLRPYLCEYSPLDVPNWLYDRKGSLQFAVVRFWEYDPTSLITFVPDPQMLQGYSYLLLVKAGYTGFDDKVDLLLSSFSDTTFPGDGSPIFSEGGWWKFTPEKELYDTGNFDDTDGEIPLYPHYYERSKGTRRRPNISRSAITELGQAAIAGMNVGSAANFNAIDIGQGLTWLQGVDEEGQELAVGQIKRGDRFIGLPPNQDTETVPTVSTSGQTSVTSSIFDTRERAIWAAAVQLGISEASGPSSAPSAAQGPGKSGAAQQAGHQQTQAPRISKVAANLEISQQIAIDFLHQRFGVGKSTGTVQWPKKFDLVQLVDRIKQFFEVQRLSGISSETLDAKAMLQFAEEKGLISPQDTQAVLAEYTKSAKVKQTTAATQAQGSRMAPPQKPGAANKQKARTAGGRADKRQAGRNTGNKSNRPAV